jgi:hypothetical protein
MHHPHKGKARAGQWSRGTGSLPASVDIVLEMHAFRADKPDDRRRWLLGHSRHEETPRRLLIEWTADGADYRVLAEPPDEGFERGWSAIRRVLSAWEAPQTAAEILRTWPATSAPRCTAGSPGRSNGSGCAVKRRSGGMRRFATGWRKGRKDERARGPYQETFYFFAVKSRMYSFPFPFSLPQ